MYHPINRLNCPPLEKFNKLIGYLLEFGLQQQLTLPEADIKPLFVLHFEGKGYPKAGGWFWRKDVTIRGLLLKLLALPVADKQEILDAFRGDIALEDRFSEGSFRWTSLPAHCANAQKHVRLLLENCYTDILAENGVPAEVLAEKGVLDRQTVLRSYLDEQNRRIPPLKVCPGCDGKPVSVSDKKINADIDHFFPKVYHPVLSVHPLNLTPYCKDCNQSYKKAKDAVIDKDDMVIDVLCLHDVFHPYFRAAQDAIQVSVETSSTDNRSRVVIKPRGNNPEQLARLHSLLYLLDIENRWSGDLEEDRLQKKLEMLLFNNTQSERDAGNFHPDKTWLKQQLRIALYTFKRYFGQEQGNIATYAYVEWLEGNDQAQADLLRQLNESLGN